MYFTHYLVRSGILHSSKYPDNFPKELRLDSLEDSGTVLPCLCNDTAGNYGSNRYNDCALDRRNDQSFLTPFGISISSKLFLEQAVTVKTSSPWTRRRIPSSAVEPWLRNTIWGAIPVSGRCRLAEVSVLPDKRFGHKGPRRRERAWANRASD